LTGSRLLQRTTLVTQSSLRPWASLVVHHPAIVGFSLLKYQPMEHAMPNSHEIEAKSHSPVPQGYVLGVN